MTPGPPPPDVAGHVDDLVQLLDQLGIGAAHVVGTSFGGVVGALLAARQPRRVRSLITIASADGFDAEMAGEVARWRDAVRRSLAGPDRGLLSDVLEPVVYAPAWVDAHREQRAERRRQIAALPDAWFEGLALLLDSTISFNMRADLERIRCPTLVLAAGLDGFVPFARARGFAEAIPGAQLEVIEGAGHAVVVERPEWIARRCMTFLDPESP